MFIEATAVQPEVREDEISTRTHIIDRLYDIRSQIKFLQEKENIPKEAIIAAMGDEDTLESERFILNRTIATRKGSIDTKKRVNAGIDPDAYRGKESTIVSLKVNLRDAFKVSLANAV